MTNDEIPQLIQQYRQRDEGATFRLWNHVRCILEQKYGLHRKVDVAEIVSHVMLKLLEEHLFDIHRCDSESNFRAWVLKVADRKIKDQKRQQRARQRKERLASELIEDDADVGLAEVAEYRDNRATNRISVSGPQRPGLFDYCRRLDTLHQYVTEQLVRCCGSVDYVAVYHFEFRFWTYTLLRRTNDVPEHEKYLLEIVESAIPWTTVVSARAFQPSWPTLGQIWEGVTPRMREGQPVDMSHVLNAAAQLNPSFNGNGPQYYQWRRRLRKRLQDLVTEEVIAQLGTDAESYEVWKAIVFCSAEI